MRARVERAGLRQRRVPRPPPAAELAQRMAAAHVVLGVFQRDGEGERVIPNKVVQGLAAGRCVVTAASEASCELLVHDGNAVLVPPGDPAALARALAGLAADPARRERLARAGRTLARTTPVGRGHGAAAAHRARRAHGARAGRRARRCACGAANRRWRPRRLPGRDRRAHPPRRHGARVARGTGPGRPARRRARRAGRDTARGHARDGCWPAPRPREAFPYSASRRAAISTSPRRGRSPRARAVPARRRPPARRAGARAGLAGRPRRGRGLRGLAAGRLRGHGPSSACVQVSPTARAPLPCAVGSRAR